MTDETLVPVGPGPLDGFDLDESAAASDAPAAPDAALAPLGLTLETLEALLFVAEKPLARREIATARGSRSRHRRRAAWRP